MTAAYVEQPMYAPANRVAADFLRVRPATLADGSPGVVLISGRHRQFLQVDQALTLANALADTIHQTKETQ